MKIAIYVAIPRAWQFRPVRRKGGAAIRACLRRWWDELHWGLGRYDHITFYVWERYAFSNKGDIAIRDAIIQQLHSAFPNDELRITEIGWGSLDDQQIEAINRDHDLFVIGGSGYLFLDGARRLKARNEQDIIAMERIHRPKIAFSIGLNYWLANLPTSGPITHEPSRSLLSRLIGGLSAISVRDPYAARELENVSSAPVAVTGDPALFLQPSEQAAPPMRRKAGSLLVGLNLALHDAGMVPLFASILPAFARFCRALAARHTVEFVYFVHAEVEYLIPRLLRRHGIVVTTIDCDAALMLRTYQTLDLHVSQMLHSAILALNAGVPTINIAYDIKNLGFFEMMGMAEYCLRADSLSKDDLLDRAESALAEQSRLRGHIRERKAELRQALDEFLAGAVARTAISAAAAATASSPPGGGP
jgi:polysaccharide pyruvyl transferase WcaK-like protein